VAAACLVTTATANAGAQNAPSVAQMLQFNPMIKGVEYDTPADQAAVAACKIESVYNADKKPIGVALRDGQGKLLRRFIDADGKVDPEGNKRMDQWSYYQDGFEVYRESDLNNDRSLDEVRWMNAAGTRIATVAGGKITGWKRLSAEEASKVFVQALVAGDLSLIETVMTTSGDLAGLGVPKGEVDQVSAAAAQRAKQVAALQGELKALGWNSKTTWNRLDGLMPHLIPADAAVGINEDLILYENAVIFPGLANGQAQPGRVAFLQAPEMIKLGEAWKFVELPRAVDPDKPVMAADGGIRAWVFRQQAGPEVGNPQVEAALKALAEYDNANAKVQAEGDKKELAQFHVGRIPLLRAVVKALPPEEQLTYNRQIVDSLAAAYQTGFYTEGLKLLDTLAKADGKTAPYAAFRKVSAEFAAKNDEPGANMMAIQKAWMNDLEAFLNKYPKSDEAPDALIQLASAHEFNAEEDDARKYYERLAHDFPETDAGKKAAGAIKRLDLVGKPFDLRGTNLQGQEIDAAQFKGKTLLVTFWASWADPVRRDLPELVKLYQKYRGKDFAIVGVNLDNERNDLDAFLKEHPLPWPQIFEPGGIERSRYATEYGIIALPTMVLVESSGKVVNRNIRTAAELERQLEKVLVGKQPGVALDR
jgi:thiol-disulfide isomerase/thioredoxin